ncbi:hypothetical protein GH714_038189 [Hevea brasiliensis]|uniref:Pectinesterase n=1 Tax=Hevea brasiliensis TaxID=3981 RepID=A0A6A6KDY6_HEVBR|nr:hypothetical protein GH714_038189 [Hevea brasiliensis]
MKQFYSLASILIALLHLQLLPTAVSNSKQVPKDFSKVGSWVVNNIKGYNQRKSDASKGIPHIALDKRLAFAEDCVRVITVAKHAFADFQTITDAIHSIPVDNKQRTIIWINGGEYWEKITINSSKPFITFYGDPGDMPKIVFNGTASQYGTVYSATVAVESNYFMAVNVAFVNAAPMPDVNRTGAQAVAMRISGDKAAFHNCQFVGFQDTLCDDTGRHLFKDCYVRGTVDFIFGNGKSLYLNTTIESVAEGTGVITAQARQNVTEDSGFTLYTAALQGSATTLTLAVHGRRGLGWTAYYGEYKCRGPGASSSGRVKYAKMLSDEEAKPFLSMTYINGNKWLIPPPKF